MSNEELLKQLEEARALVAKLQAQKSNQPRALTFKISEKGAVCVYGLQRFPVTLYGSQWERLIEAMPKLKEFIEANQDKLTSKGVKEAA